LKISGTPSGTDNDWVVKLINVCPDQAASQPELAAASNRMGNIRA
jgi:hypothetical protein